MFMASCRGTVGIRPVKTVGRNDLYCVGADVKPCSINGSRLNNSGISCGQTSVVVSGKGVVLQ